MSTLLDENLSEEAIQTIIEAHLHKYGKITRRTGGMCGSVYLFDQGQNVHPRWIAVKIPRTPGNDRKERNRRFVREMEIQHRTYRHNFVCWPADYVMIVDTPAAIYRASDGDFTQLIPRDDFSIQSRLAVLIYVCSAIGHCRSRGMECHQDLKPQNILFRDIASLRLSVPEQEVFIFPQLADFGLANSWRDEQNPQGARPYMAPEQWLEGRATPESDIFSLGVIIFEVMTLGRHPVGQVTREWWPEPSAENSRKWLRDDMWLRWAKQGAHIAPTPFLVDGIDSVVHECLKPDPAERPSLASIQSRLLEVLRQIDPEAAHQAEFQAFHADHDTTNNEWPHRDRKLALLKEAVNNLG